MKVGLHAAQMSRTGFFDNFHKIEADRGWNLPSFQRFESPSYWDAVIGYTKENGSDELKHTIEKLTATLEQKSSRRIFIGLSAMF